NGASRVCWVDIGVERPALLQAKVREGETLNFRIVSIRPLKVELVNKKDITLYWGYKTEIANGLYETLKNLKKNSLVIATSKKGEVLDINLLKKIGQKMHKSNNTSIIFGSPIKGLDEILSNSSEKISDLSDYVINTIPNQGTETVRTEEAIFATLAQLNLVRWELRKGDASYQQPV
ncbi:MAG: putative RNA uridine N3 methyltransferase, partial [Methanosarcinales archaeon]